MAVSIMCPSVSMSGRDRKCHILGKEKGRTEVGAPFVFGQPLGYLKSSLFTAFWT